MTQRSSRLGPDAPLRRNGLTGSVGALCGVALFAAFTAGCATGDGRQLRDPVFDLPAPPETVLDVTPAEIPTLPPFSSAPAIEPVPESMTEQLAPPPSPEAQAAVQALITP